MGEMPAWIPLATVAFAALGSAGVFWWVRRRLDRAAGPPTERGTVQMQCGVCHHPMTIARTQLVVLSGPEMALVVRSMPGWVKRKLGEYECPHCSAAHVFAMETNPPAYLGADIYTPHARGNKCMECGKAMTRPAWPKGTYDGRLGEPAVSFDHGLECQFCKSVFCLECAERVSRTRRKDGVLLCPRCFRSPVEHVFHG